MKGFVSYSHADFSLYKQFSSHLEAIRHQCNVELWTDHDIFAGTRWEPRIDSEISASEIFILLISPEFIASKYVFDVEIPAIKARRQAGSLVLPVVLRRCCWPLVAAALQAIPLVNGRVHPITDWHRRDHGFDHAREQITLAIVRHFGITPNRVEWPEP